MRRFAMVGAVLAMGTVLGVLAPVAGSTAAWAGGPEHVKSTETGGFTLEAGEFCDFTLGVVGTFSDDAVIFPDKEIHHIRIQFADTNLDTGFTLTERDNVVEHVTRADGQVKEVGLHVSFRTPDGKLVVHYAGLVVFDGEGNVLRFTPNSTNLAGFAAVLCTALGGSPAS
jgi:hypothetical protein